MQACGCLNSDSDLSTCIAFEELAHDPPVAIRQRFSVVGHDEYQVATPRRDTEPNVVKRPGFVRLETPTAIAGSFESIFKDDRSALLVPMGPFDIHSDSSLRGVDLLWKVSRSVLVSRLVGAARPIQEG